VEDTYTVRPYILKRDAEVADVDGVGALIVPLSEDLARDVIGAIGREDMEARAVTVEEIEALCAYYGLATVGLFGLDDGGGLDVLSVETVGMVLEREEEA
jgi:hypothetical protein